MTAPLDIRSTRSRFSMARLSNQVLNGLKGLIPPVVALVVFLVVWQILTMSPSANLPTPIRTVQDTWELIVNPFFNYGGTDKGLFWQVLTSLQRVAIGFSLAAIVGVALGILVGTSSLMYNALDPLFQILRTVPPLAWLPISLAAFQQAGPSAIFVIFITAIWPIIINTTEGVRQIPQDYNNVAKVLRLSKPKYFLRFCFPLRCPTFSPGCVSALVCLGWPL